MTNLHRDIIRQEGKIYEPHKARKRYRCKQCHEEIEPGTYYYAVFIGGSGLGGIKFPDRIHLKCRDRYSI